MLGRDRAEDWPRHRLDAAIDAALLRSCNVVDRVLHHLGRTATVDEDVIEALRERASRRRDALH